MPIVYVALVIIAAGVLLWIVNTYVPMQAQAKQLLNIVVVGGLALWIVMMLLRTFGTGPRIG
jgi:hypothetical protein